MWTRKQLKDKAKASFRVNYWKTVLVALLVLAISGGMSAAAGTSSRTSDDQQAGMGVGSLVITANDETVVVSPEELEHLFSETGEGGSADSQQVVISLGEDGSVKVTGAEEDAGTEEHEGTLEIPRGLIAVAGLALAMLVIVTMAVAVAAVAFVINPASVGFSRFFLCNLNQPAKVREVAYGFDHNYRETVKTMFWRDLYTVLWGLLLIVPGIVKAYEYSMIPYLLAEDPTMTRERAFAESKRMMDGNKWKAFVLDLSFLGWAILSALTLGIVAIFYAKPYQCMTKAALYEALRYGPSATDPEGHTLGVPSATAVATDEVPVPPFAAADAPQPAWDDDQAYVD